jgi:hypothetical protein
VTLTVDPVDAAELVTCQTCGDHLMCAPGHPAHLVHCGDGSHTVHLGHPAADHG